MKIERPPWIEWANRDTLIVPNNMSAEANLVVPTSKQLCSASIGRPIAWCFLFWARILDVDPIAESTVTVDFNVSSGAGLAKATMAIFPTSIAHPGFCRFVFHGTPIPLNATKWTSTVLSPPFDDTLADDNGQAIDRIIAERVECNASVFYESSELPTPLNVDLFAGFAPYNMRDEWFEELATYGL